MEKELLKNFVFNDKYLKGSSYIFPDGRYFNLQDNLDKLENQKEKFRAYTHTSLDTWMEENSYTDKFVPDCFLRLFNCVKINDGLNFDFQQAHMALPKEPLSSEQYKVLEDWLYYIMTIEKNTHLEIQTKTFAKLFKFKDFKSDSGDFPEDIIKWIKKYYIEKAKDEERLKREKINEE